MLIFTFIFDLILFLFLIVILDVLRKQNNSTLILTRRGFIVASLEFRLVLSNGTKYLMLMRR